MTDMQFLDADSTASLEAMLDRAFANLAPLPKMNIGEWAERYRVLSGEESSMPGRYSLEVTPILRGILEACSDPRVRRVVCMKSAQVGWTVGVVCNVLGYHVHYRPSVQVAVFPRLQAGKDFALEKFDPFVRSTAVLSERIELKSRAQGNSMTRKRYPGGLIKFVGGNSPSDVKSTSARIVVIEEPDDISADVRGQGGAIKLAAERAKTYPDHLVLIGGTPTAKGASAVEAEMVLTDERRFWVPCHHCGEEHVLDWRHVSIPEDPAVPAHDVYGHAQWAQAFYSCPHCGGLWDDDERVSNIRRGHWVASQPQSDPSVVGFYTSELYSTGAESRVPILARKYLEAKAKMEAGEPGDMVAFWNSSLGLPWEYKGELPEESELEERAEDYAEWSCPAGGLEPMLTVDVQHDRLAVTCWVAGRGEEMWLAYWGELHGQTVVAHAGAWVELERMLDQQVKHRSGASMRITGVAIDCSDGQTSEAVYAFARRWSRPGRPVLAVKGAADSVGKVEIWRPPQPIDPGRASTKASRFGVNVHIVGTAKAKDLLLGWATEAGRVRLKGEGPGRMHWYKAVRADFYKQLLSEIKVPSRTNPNQRQWKPRTDRRNEALDCTVYAVYLTRHLKLHLRRPGAWALRELEVLQAQLPLSGEPIAPAPLPAEPVKAETPPADLQSMIMRFRRERANGRQPA